LDSLLDYLEQEQPDILVAQEVFNCDDTSAPQRFRSIEAIQKRLNFPSWKFAEAFIDNEEGHRFPSGNAVFSRFPVIKHTVISFDVPFTERKEHNAEAFANTPRNLQHIVVHTDEADFNIFNVQGVWDLDGDNASPRRIAMCITIADTVRDKSHVLLAGDMNLKPTNTALKPINELLESVFKDELTTSFNVRRKDLKKFPGYATAVVDLMYASSDLQIMDHRCPEVDISDHLPLVATIELQKEQA